MKRKLILLGCLTATTLTFADEVDQSLVSWVNKKEKVKTEVVKPVVDENVFCDNKGRVKLAGEFLYWSTTYNLPYSFRVGSDITTALIPPAGVDISQTESLSGKVMRIHNAWDPGFRLSMSLFPKNDMFDVAILWTSFHNREKGSGKGDNNVFFGAFNSAAAHAKLRYNMADLEIGKSFGFTKYLELRPFAGVRAGWINVHQKVSFAGSSTVANASGADVTEPVSIDINLKQKVQAIGPRIGLNTNWFHWNGLSILGNISSSLIYGKGKQKLFVLSETFSNNNGQLELDELKLGAKDNFYALYPSLQLMLGLSWEHCMKKNRSFRLYAGWETNFWWNTVNILWIERGFSVQGLTAGASVNF